MPRYRIESPVEAGRIWVIHADDLRHARERVVLQEGRERGERMIITQETRGDQMVATVPDLEQFLQQREIRWNEYRRAWTQLPLADVTADAPVRAADALADPADV